MNTEVNIKHIYSGSYMKKTFILVDITKEYILDVMRALLVRKDPEDNEKYEQTFFTNEGTWNLLKDEINEFGDACNSKQLAK